MLVLRTFGGLSLLDDEQRVVVADQRRRLALLALLAMASERGMSRDKILAFLWPESPTENARHALHQLLYYLRRDAHPDLFVGTDPLRLNPQIVTSDVSTFSSALAAGSHETAVASYAGPFLDGFFLSNAPEFENWVEQQRARLHAEFTTMLHRLAIDADDRASHSEAIERWRAFAAADALDARATLGLMRALVAAGDPIGALRQARIYENLVQKEIGQASAPEIVAYVAELRAAGAVANARNADSRGALLHSREPEALSSGAPAPIASASRWSRGRILATALATVTVMLVIIGGYTAVQPRGAVSDLAVSTAAAPAIAILPFGINDPALQTWRNGTLVSLAASIDGTAGIRAIDPQAILASLGEMSDTLPDRGAALAVARHMGARYALVGNVVTIGSTMRINADLYETERGRRLRQLQAHGASNQIFTLLDGLAFEAVEVMLRQEGVKADAARVEIASNATASLPALKAYLEGEELYQQSRFAEAAEAYGRALEADSMFALMFSRFVVPYSFVNEAAPKSIGDPLAHALRMIERLPRRERLLVQASYEIKRENVAEATRILQQASNEYPDDYEVWYSLGEVALHRGGDLLLPPDEAIRAFNNSVQLNPRFSPPYSHLIELLLAQRGDSARAAAVSATYERIAPEAENRMVGGLALALAFGNAAARAQALAVLDTLPLVFVMEVAVFLMHPRMRAGQEAALAVLADRTDDHSPGGHAYAVRGYLWRGQLSAALGLALEHDDCAPLTIYWAYLYGKSRLPAAAEAALQPDAASSWRCKYTATFIAGAYAAERQHGPALESARSLLLAGAAERLAGGDSTNAEQFRLWAEALRGYALARSGQLETGIELLETLQPRLASSINQFVRWWQGTLLLQAGRPLEARRYFASFWHGDAIPASYQLGRIDEQLGHPAEARAHYARFADGWRSADPELLPLVVDAHARAKRLASSARR
jgi:serine/threonine-protein kinase